MGIRKKTRSTSEIIRFIDSFRLPETYAEVDPVRWLDHTDVVAAFVAGVADGITCAEQKRILYKASDYAKQYNILLLHYLREHPNT
jgi:hypothetical protein